MASTGGYVNSQIGGKRVEWIQLADGSYAQKVAAFLFTPGQDAMGGTANDAITVTRRRSVATRMGRNISKWANDWATWDTTGKTVCTASTLFYNLAADERVMVSSIMINSHNTGVEAHVEVGYCTSAIVTTAFTSTQAGSFTPMGGEFHLRSGEAGPTGSFAPWIAQQLTFSPPLVARYGSGARVVTMRCQPDTGTGGMLELMWLGWAETE